MELRRLRRQKTTADSLRPPCLGDLPGRLSQWRIARRRRYPSRPLYLARSNDTQQRSRFLKRSFSKGVDSSVAWFGPICRSLFQARDRSAYRPWIRSRQHERPGDPVAKRKARIGALARALSARAKSTNSMTQSAIRPTRQRQVTVDGYFRLSFLSTVHDQKERGGISTCRKFRSLHHPTKVR